MQEIATTYQSTLYAFAALAALMLIQILVVDIIGIRRKHVPGSDIKADHNDILFRANRALGNTNESIAAFILLTLFCVLGGSSPYATAIAAWVFFSGRLGHTIFYYAGMGILRSVSFAIAMLALLALLIIGLIS